MPPKTARGKKAVAVKIEDDHLKTNVAEYLQAFEEEAHQRHEAMLARHEDLCAAALADLLTQISALPKDILNMSLRDLAKIAPNSNGQGKENEGADELEVEVIPAVNIKKDVKKEVFARPSIITNINAPIVDETVKRPPNRKPRTEHQLKTPSGREFAVPALITPRVDYNNTARFRSARRSEVAFSVNGSPIVVDNVEGAVEGQSDFIQKMLNMDYNTLTPESRLITDNLRALLRKKNAMNTPDNGNAADESTHDDEID